MMIIVFILNACASDAQQFISAAETDDLSTIQMLLKKDIEPNVCNEQGLTALMYAAQYGHLSIVEALLEAKADPNVVDLKGSTALMYAATLHRTKIITLLIKQGAHIHLHDLGGLTALDYAHLSDLKDQKYQRAIKQLQNQNAPPPNSP